MIKRPDIRTLEQHPQPPPEVDSLIHSSMQAQFRSLIPSDIQPQVEPETVTRSWTTECEKGLAASHAPATANSVLGRQGLL